MERHGSYAPGKASDVPRMQAARGVHPWLRQASSGAGRHGPGRRANVPIPKAW